MERNTKNVDLSINSENMKGILKKIMASRTMNLASFFNLIVESAENIEKGVEIDIVKDSIDVVFKDLLTDKEREIFKDCLDQNNDSVIDTREMVSIIKASIPDELDQIQAHFAFYASILDRKNISTGSLDSMR
jgi:uncharacterized protein YicC (UPF0701 family)